ncbi:cytochrome ubiquinol oxidase subunit I, partial [Plantactinospora sp. B6F1]
STRPPQLIGDELRHEVHDPEADVPTEEGAHGAEAAVAYHPPAGSGARPIEVPEPDDVRRPTFEPSRPDEHVDDSDRGGAESPRWRTGRARPESQPEDAEEDDR